MTDEAGSKIKNKPGVPCDLSPANRFLLHPSAFILVSQD
jgi:hypothetical protein